MIRKRHLLEAVQKHIGHKQYTIITGARQVGKTSILQYLFQQLKSEGKKVYFLSLEDHRVLHEINEHPDKLLNFLKERPVPILKGKQENPIYVLIDEVQYANTPTHFLKYLYDKYESNIKIIATGSSAFYIDRKFKDSLAGRKRIFNLHPLSFEEFLSFKDAEEMQNEIEAIRNNQQYQSREVEALNSFFHEYLTFGGYPEVVLESDNQEKIQLLTELKNSYIKRDLLESGVEHEGKFYVLLQILADQVGNLVNRNELGTTIQLDAKTIDKYLYILQKCYHIHLVRPFFRNLRKELTKMPKVFFSDLGLRNSFLNRFSEVTTRADKGALLENYFFLQLRQNYALDQLKYWRTADKHEVDFVIEESFGQGKAYEVKWNPATFKRKKYLQFIQTYEKYPLSVLSAENFYLI